LEPKNNVKHAKAVLNNSIEKRFLLAFTERFGEQGDSSLGQ
jgi:hypothetical protein